MDLLKMRLPLALVLGALGTAAGVGGTWAMNNSRQEATAAKVDGHSSEIESLRRESQSSRERVLRIEITTQQTKEAVDRIERKLDAR